MDYIKEFFVKILDFLSEVGSKLSWLGIALAIASFITPFKIGIWSLLIIIPTIVLLFYVVYQTSKQLRLADDIWDLFSEALRNPPNYHFGRIEAYFEVRPNLKLKCRMDIEYVVGKSELSAVEAYFSVAQEVKPLRRIRGNLRVKKDGVAIRNIRIKDQSGRYKKWAVKFMEPIREGTTCRVVHELQWPSGWKPLKMPPYEDHVSYTAERRTESLTIVVKFPSGILRKDTDIHFDHEPKEEGIFKELPEEGAYLEKVVWEIKKPAENRRYLIRMSLEDSIKHYLSGRPSGSISTH